jgi:mannose-6-phosphate isomerase-like protein (cupin superfamily)
MTMRAGEVYEHPYERLVVRVGTAESDGSELVADLYVRADAPGVPRHSHPTVAETVTVIRGKVRAWSPDEGERILGPGETLRVPPNTKHGWHPGVPDARALRDRGARAAAGRAAGLIRICKEVIDGIAEVGWRLVAGCRHQQRWDCVLPR